jgi:hypothetical protein
VSVEDRDRFFSDAEIFDLLEKAEAAGFNLEKGSDLEQLSLGELDRLVNGTTQ